MDGLKDLAVFIITGVFVYVGHAVGSVKDSVDGAKNSIVELNKNIAVILTRLQNHEQQIGRHEDRIEKLEDKV